MVNPTAATATEKYFYVSEDDVYYQATGGNFIELYEDEVFDESKESTRLKISKFPDISMIFTYLLDIFLVLIFLKKMILLKI